MKKVVVLLFVVLLMLGLSLPASANDPFSMSNASSNWVPYYDCGLVDLNTGIVWLKDLPNNSVYAVVAEPAYIVSAAGACPGSWQFANAKEVFSLLDTSDELTPVEKMAESGFLFSDGVSPVDFEVTDPLDVSINSGMEETVPALTGERVFSLMASDDVTDQYHSFDGVWSAANSVEGTLKFWPIVRTIKLSIPSVEVVSFTVSNYVVGGVRNYLKGTFKVRADTFTTLLTVKLFKQDIGGGNRVLVKSYKYSNMRPGVAVTGYIYVNGNTTSWRDNEYVLEIVPASGQYVTGTTLSAPVVLSLQ